MGVPARERETVGQRIRRLRKERGLSQIVLAEQVGVTDAWISQVETDKSTASAELLHNIASILKIPIRDLLQDEEAHLELSTRIKLVEVLLEAHQPDEAEEVLAGLLQHPHLSESDSIKLTLYQAECKHQQTQYEQALEFLLPLILQLENMNYHDAHLLASIHNQIGKTLFERQDFTGAFYRFQKAHDLIGRFAQFDSLAARISYNVGITMRRIGRARDSISYLEDANRYATAHQDVKGLAQTCFVQGISYKNIRNYDKAVECFEEAKSLYKSLNLISFFTMAQMIMAYSVTAEKNPLLALQQLEDCAASFRHENDHKQLTQALAKMAGVYLQLHQDEKALACLKQAEECVRVHAMQRDPETGELYRTFSSYFFKQRDYRQAIEYGLRSAELFEGIGLIGDQVDSLQVVADAFREMGDLGQAWHYERMCVQRLKQLQEGSMVL